MEKSNAEKIMEINMRMKTNFYIKVMVQTIILALGILYMLYKMI